MKRWSYPSTTSTFCATPVKRSKFRITFWTIDFSNPFFNNKTIFSIIKTSMLSLQYLITSTLTNLKDKELGLVENVNILFT
ncbi:hypothetical protein BpHYR1_004378 [Brachionus plicatilis]|uniref:Uncharacterized protein n=1 Tax=Brachionus plicatilis TaxID=10195 RepID=A0A3M7Q5P1_BRAPC|nr:hypothetical protein BpHYR1_004378 [Brachionus plicatilis]